METDDAASRFRTAANAANAASVDEKDSDGAEDAPAKARTSYIESPTAARFRAAATAVSAVDRMRLAAENEKLKALQDQVDKVKALQDRHVQRLPAPLRCLLCGACWTAYGVRDMITKPGTIEFAGAFIFGEAFGALITSISADLVGPIMSVILPPWDPLVFAWGAAGFLVISVPLGPNATGYEPVSKEEALADGASILDFGHLGQAVLDFVITMVSTYAIFLLLEKSVRKARRKTTMVAAENARSMGSLGSMNAPGAGGARIASQADSETVAVQAGRKSESSASEVRAAVALVWTGGGGRFAADIQGNDLPADIVDHFGGGDNGERLVASVLAELLGSGYAVVSAAPVSAVSLGAGLSTEMLYTLCRPAAAAESKGRRDKTEASHSLKC